MPRIFYKSCHPTLEYIELKILCELFGSENVFSLGHYTEFEKPVLTSREPLYFPTNEEWVKHIRSEYPNYYATQPMVVSRKTLDKFGIDTVFINHYPEALVFNEHLFKDRFCILRSIGMNSTFVEGFYRKFKEKYGFKVVRLCGTEENLPNPCPSDGLIRHGIEFDKFDKHFYMGDLKRCIIVNKWLKKRGNWSQYYTWLKFTSSFDRLVVGMGNEDITEAPVLSDISWNHLVHELIRSRVYTSTCSIPGGVTFSTLEAAALSLPIVSIGKVLGCSPDPNHPQYTLEIPDIFTNGVDCFYSDDVDELKEYIRILMNDYDLAKKMGEAGKETVRKLFSYDVIKSQWEGLFKKWGLI